jgi:Mn-dependent DtxR family transcriptional regulator
VSQSSRYLLVLYEAERRASGPVATGDVAEAVGRSPAAASEMLGRLEERGLVVQEPYEGATLTAEGRDRAEGLYETYTTLSRFFEEVLELDDHDDEAMRLAGVVSPDVAERLTTTLLGEPPPGGGEL